MAMRSVANCLPTFANSPTTALIPQHPGPLPKPGTYDILEEQALKPPIPLKGFNWRYPLLHT